MVGPECFRGRYRFDSNEVETGKYSGSWLLRIESTRILFPAFTLPLRGMIGLGKSYPVTAAQLLPILTGIPRTAPRPQLTKNCGQK
jgi:hypothetical protein